jgi:hypothetical protein
MAAYGHERPVSVAAQWPCLPQRRRARVIPRGVVPSGLGRCCNDRMEDRYRRKGYTNCLQQSEYDDAEVIVSTFITLQNLGRNGFAVSG